MNDNGETRNLVLSMCDMKHHGDVPPPCVAPQCVILGVRMYLFGGANEVSSFETLYIFEIAREQWSIVKTSGMSRPSARYGHSFNAFDDSIILFGGMEQAPDEIKRAATPTYSPPPCVHRQQHGKVKYWYHRGAPSNALYLYDTVTQTWKIPSTRGECPTARAFHASCIVSSSANKTSSNYLVIYGGCSSDQFDQALSDVHLLDLESWTWSQIDTNSVPRFGHQLIYVAAQDALFTFGIDPADSNMGALFKGRLVKDDLSGDGKTLLLWEKETAKGTPPVARKFYGLAHFGQYTYVISGLTDSGQNSDFYVYDQSLARWSKPLYEHDLNLSASGITAFVDKILIFGGSMGISQKALALSEYKKSKTKAGGTSVSLAHQEDSRLSRHLSFCTVLQVKNMMTNAQRFKLVAVGDSGVGKSSLLQRFTQDVYKDEHNATIGVDFYSVPTMVSGKLVSIQLWDTAGQERYSGITGNYYRNANGFIIVFDATKRESFNHIPNWIQQIKHYHEFDLSTVKLIIGNKQDLTTELVVSDSEAESLADSLDAIYLATSAKTGAGVDTAFLLATKKLLDIKKTQDLPKTRQGGPIRLPSAPVDTSTAWFSQCCSL